MGLHVEQVNKAFAGVRVITDLSMEVREGTIFGFLGPNGAGKTTTMRMILDILRPDSGWITWNGQEVSVVPRRAFGYLPEERGLYPKVEVEEQLLFLARLHGLTKATARAQLNEWIERFPSSTKDRPSCRAASVRSSVSMGATWRVSSSTTILVRAGWKRFPGSR